MSYQYLHTSSFPTVANNPWVIHKVWLKQLSLLSPASTANQDVDDNLVRWRVDILKSSILPIVSVWKTVRCGITEAYRRFLERFCVEMKESTCSTRQTGILVVAWSCISSSNTRLPRHCSKKLLFRWCLSVCNYEKRRKRSQTKHGAYHLP